MKARLPFAIALLLTLGAAGTALATGNHEKKDFKPCKLEVTDSPRIHNKHCKPSPTPVQTPEVTPKPTRSPKATPTPAVTPTHAPVSAPVTKTTSSIKQPTVLPSVGGSGKLHK